MCFVNRACIARHQIFGIPLQSRFDVKASAGNIIPAIATTNAVIAGMIVMEALKLLAGQVERCRAVRCFPTDMCRAFCRITLA